MFQDDNRGLMKRLYGDMESHSVYREMRSINGHAQPPPPEEETAEEGGRQREQQDEAVNNPLDKLGPFASLEYNVRLGSGLATVQSAREPVR